VGIILSFIESIATSFAVSLVSNLVYDGFLDKNDKRVIENIKKRIINFNRRYDNTVLDSNTFDKFLKTSEVDKLILNYIFNNFKQELKASSVFKLEIAQNAIEFVNAIYEECGRSKIKDEDVFLEYFSNLIDEISIIRYDILNLHEKVIVATVAEEFSKNSDRVIDEITKEINSPKYNNSNDQIERITIENSKRIYHNEIEESRNLITSQMNINKSLFADMTVHIKENKTSVDRVRFNSELEIPIVQCLELIDSCRDEFVNRDKDNSYEFKAKGALITAVGGMGKSISMIYLWRYILDLNNRGVFYIQLNEVNERSNIDNYVVEIMTEKLFYNSLFSCYPKHKQIEILKEFLNVNRKSTFRFVILLDGFNEIHPNKRIPLKCQIEELLYLKGVIVIITTRPDLEIELSSNTLANCYLNKLDGKTIYSLLSDANITELNSELRSILSNVLMITLYGQICNWIKKDRGNDLFDFSDNINSESELISNFIESLLCKNYYERKHHSDQLILTFSLKYLIPYIGYKLYTENAYKIKDRYHLWTIIEEFKTKVIDDTNHFYEREIQYLLLDFLNEWTELLDNNFSNNLANEIINKSILIQPDEDGGYKFWHQNFRDFMSARYICNEINRSLSKNEIAEEAKYEWDANLLKYISEILEANEKAKNSIINKMLDVMSFRREDSEIVIVNILKVCLQKNHVISDLNFNSLDLRNISLYGLRCRNLTFTNCMLSWNLFEPYKGNERTFFINSRISDGKNIVASKSNRILYGNDSNQLHIISINGVISLANSWSSNLTGIRYLNKSIYEVYHSKMCNNGKHIIISSANEFIIVDIISNKVLNNIVNRTYFTDDNRTYTNRVIKGIFSAEANSALILRENRKVSSIPITCSYEKDNIDYLKIIGCVSQDNSLFSYRGGRELYLSNCRNNYSRLFFLDEDYIYLQPMKFSYNNEILALFDEPNNNIVILEINGEVKFEKLSIHNESGVRFLEFSRCSSFIALVHDDNCINIYSINDMTLIYEMKYDNHDVVGIALSHNAKEIFILDSNNRISIIQRISETVIFSGIIQKTFFENTLFDNCRFTDSDNNAILSHLKLHGAKIKN